MNALNAKSLQDVPGARDLILMQPEQTQYMSAQPIFAKCIKPVVVQMIIIGKS